jgi:acyl dehydratase
MKATVVDGLEIGARLPSLTVRFTRERLVRYAGASTDFNPIHYSEYFARQVGLPGVIAHGMLTMGTALRIVTNWVGDPGRVISYAVRFTRPVVVPDDADGVDVEFSGSVSAIDGSLVTVSIDAISGGQKVLGAARAEVDLGVRVPQLDHGTSHAP